VFVAHRSEAYTCGREPETSGPRDSIGRIRGGEMEVERPSPLPLGVVEDFAGELATRPEDRSVLYRFGTSTAER